MQKKKKNNSTFESLKPTKWAFKIIQWHGNPHVKNKSAWTSQYPEIPTYIYYYFEVNFYGVFPVYFTAKTIKLFEKIIKACPHSMESFKVAN